jgi:hypothetical protein
LFMKKILLTPFIIVVSLECFSQLSVCFQKDTISVQRANRDETHFFKIDLKVPKDSVVKISIVDTRLGSLPAIDYILDPSRISFSADTNSRTEQIIPVTIKGDSLKNPDRVRTIIITFSIINFKKDRGSTLLTNQCKIDTLIILVKPVGYSATEMSLPNANDAAVVCIKNDRVSYYEFITEKRSVPNQQLKGKKKEKGYTISDAAKGQITVDSMRLKFEDKTLCEIQVYGRDVSDSQIKYLFENKNDIPVRGLENRTNMTFIRLVDYTRINRFSSNPPTLIRKFIYLGDVLNIVPVLENYTFDYAPGDTVISISRNKCAEPGQLPRSSIVSMIQLRIMNDLMAMLADRPNGVIQAHFRARLNTNFINLGKNTLLHETEVVASYIQYSKANRFLRLQTDKADNNRYANLMNVIERPTFFLGLRENLFKREYRPTSTKFNVYFLAGIGFTKVKDTILSTDQSTTTKTVEDKILKFSLIGLETRLKFMAMKGFFSEIGAQVLSPFILTQSVKEDVGPILDEDEVPFGIDYSFVPQTPKFKDRLIFSPYINFTIYPDKHSHSATMHIRGQWFKSLTNKNSFIQLQLGANLDLKKILGKSASSITSKF